MAVEDTFDITGRGLVVVPGPLAKDFAGPAKVQARLYRPDGSWLAAPLLIQHHFQTPPPKEHRWACVFTTLSKQDVPTGTEIWLDGAQHFAQADTASLRGLNQL